MKNVLTALTLALTVALASSPAFAGKNDPRGSAAGRNSNNSNPTLEHCDRTLGTVAVVEEQDGDWYRYLTSDLRLPSTIPVIRMLIQQSNCFVVVERGRAMRNMMQERELMNSGELREGSNFGRGQMVAADYTINPSITFSQSDAGGIGGLIGSFGGKWGAAGALIGGLKFKKAETMLTLIDNRSGVQLGIAQGNATKTDFALGFGGGGGSGFGGLGGYTSTPEGKAIAAAFVNAYNNLVVSLREYQAQEVDGGLGRGGNLPVGE
ncbi:MAG: peptidoglycan-binding protein [Thermomonas sp.]|uniref:CsgG/HfaB family protein n=1 Tax=Thermomonas sp. TaxID=1971895 RepID=UPI001D59CDE1|nr:CsgG/HfaB family protein [Thermomonas sp.]MBZ0088513.1 peptidoglycan-binding protein [Thermomonas sp.]MCO5054895.1 peptidoglycan-binding protein [Thermomonas sp.]